MNTLNNEYYFAHYFYYLVMGNDQYEEKYKTEPGILLLHYHHHHHYYYYCYIIIIISINISIISIIIIVFCQIYYNYLITKHVKFHNSYKQWPPLITILHNLQHTIYYCLYTAIQTLCQIIQV